MLQLNKRKHKTKPNITTIIAQRLRHTALDPKTKARTPGWPQFFRFFKYSYHYRVSKR